MSEPTLNEAVTTAGAPRPPQGNKFARAQHLERVGGKARGGGKGKISLKTVILGLVALVSILGLAVVGVIGGVWWGVIATREAERTKEGERTKLEWEERKKDGADAADNGHTKVQLWKGGPYWADTNIGAEKPWEPGYYFWWGDTVGYKRQGGAWVASNGPESDFSFNASNTPTCGMSLDELLSEGWITSDNILTREHDAAHIHWGGGWRMPTEQELDDLMSMCDWTWAKMNGVNGYVVRGRGAYVYASIFLPCAGTSLPGGGSDGSYWSSVTHSDNNSDYSWYLFFSSDRYDTGSSCRYFGHSVRPVQKKRKKRAQPIL